MFDKIQPYADKLFQFIESPFGPIVIIALVAGMIYVVRSGPTGAQK